MCYLKIIIPTLLIIGLLGCMSFQPLKAPCNEYASGCGQKIRINP